MAEQFWPNGQLRFRKYWVNNQLHNLEGPASEYWYKNAQLWERSYWVNDLLHNLDGPAYERWHANGQLADQQYWIEGTQYSKAEFLAQVYPTKSANKT